MEPEVEKGVLEAVSAVIKTIENPSAVNLLADLEIAISLVKQLKTILDGTSPTVSKLVKKLLFGC